MHKEILAFKVFNLFLFHTLPVVFFSIFHKKIACRFEDKQKSEGPYSPICGLGASVGCERISEHSTCRNESHR